MHHALDLPEILYNIFGHCAPDGDWGWSYERLPCTSVLAKLARTCRAFKEPALDVLWSELPDPSPLARCVPNAVRSEESCHYAFKRLPTKAEWDTIRSYARRVWIFHGTVMEACLDESAVEILLFGYTAGALFPSLRSLSWNDEWPFLLLHFAAKPLRTLRFDLKRAEILAYRNILYSVGNLCPLIKNFRLYMPHQVVELDNIISNQVLNWSNLRILECREVALNADTILHVSRMSTLTRLSLILSKETPAQILPSDFVLVFSNLSWCEISSGWLLPVANLFARTRLPAITELTVTFPGSPSKQTIRSFMTALRDMCSSGTLTRLSILNQRYLLRHLSACGDVGLKNYPIIYDDLYPCMVFGNLRSLKVNFDQAIHLTDNDLVELGSAWPHLYELSINNERGWRSTGGLTLRGLVRLLRTCPALRNFCILFDTPTFTYIPEGVDVSYPSRGFGDVNLVDSQLEVGMFAGVVDVFVAIEFSPRLVTDFLPYRIEEQALMHVAETRRLWQNLNDEVRARLDDVGETKDELGA